jgi:dTDP-4-amino-4,6-dideoxygalactose transaminase
MIPLFKVFMNPEVDEALLRVIHSGWIGQGPNVKAFEFFLSERFNNKLCLALSAGTHGLHLALRMLGVGKGDNVVTTALTCTATNWPILMQGADIRWADVKKEDLNIDPDSIYEKINYKTKAVIVVHWGGYPCDMKEIYAICSEREIPIIEDAAHAFGSTYRESIIGDCTYSDFVMMSFQAIKHLNCLDGGALFCRYEDHYDRGKLLRWYGIDREGSRVDLRCEEDIKEFGYKYHMNDVCATIGISNIKNIGENLRITKDNAKFYMNNLKDVSGVELIQTEQDRQSSYWLFTIYVEDRTGFARKMGEKGIMVSRVHERNDKHSCVKEFKTDFPVLDEVIHKMLCIPVGWWVSEEDRQYIVESIKEGW